MVLVHHEIPIVPLKIVGEDIDLMCVVHGQDVQPFEKISNATSSSEAKGSRVVFGFDCHQIGHMLFLGLHAYGFDVKEDTKGRWCFFLVVLVFWIEVVFIALQGLKAASVGVVEIGALFLETGATMKFGLTTVKSLVVVGGKAMSTNVTGSKNPWETGDDIVMCFVVKQDQLFGEGWSKTTHMVRSVCVDQEESGTRSGMGLD